MEVQHFELEAGQSLQINHMTLTVVDITDGEICIKIDDDSSLFPIQISELLSRIPK